MTPPDRLKKGTIPITWDGNLPPEIKAAVAPVLTAYAPMLPPRLEDLRVRYDSDRDACMATQVDYRNRWVRLIVTGHWLNESPQQREEAVRHEIVHMLLAPLQAAVQRIVDDTLKPTTGMSAAYDLAISLAVDGEEATTEDIARAFGRMETR